MSEIEKLQAEWAEAAKKRDTPAMQAIQQKINAILLKQGRENIA